MKTKSEYRTDLQAALESLDSALTLGGGAITEDELVVIRHGRAEKMLKAAQNLYTAITGKAVMTYRGAQ